MLNCSETILFIVMPTLSMMARITLRRNNMEGRRRKSIKRALLTRITQSAVYVNSGITV